MATSYALPTTTIHHHHCGSDHGCAHSHSHSHSHSHTSSLSSLSPSRSRKDSRANGAYSHTRSPQHDGNRSQHRANANVPMPLNLSAAHWRTESTPGGKPVVTPTAATFDAAGMYEPPTAASSQANSHSHHHDHAAERSRFTALLLPYTSRWPLLHAVLADRDSRRIFYFMRFVTALTDRNLAQLTYFTLCTA